MTVKGVDMIKLIRYDSKGSGFDLTYPIWQIKKKNKDGKIK